jgi:hypothetical protein
MSKCHNLKSFNIAALGEEYRKKGGFGWVWFNRIKPSVRRSRSFRKIDDMVRKVRPGAVSFVEGLNDAERILIAVFLDGLF